MVVGFTHVQRFTTDRAVCARVYLCQNLAILIGGYRSMDGDPLVQSRTSKVINHFAKRQKFNLCIKQIALCIKFDPMQTRGLFPAFENAWANG